MFIFAAHSVKKSLVAQLNRKKGPVAQLNRAFDYGSKGFWFESRRGHKKASQKCGAFFMSIAQMK